MLAVSYLEKNSKVDEEEIRDLVASNLCRCTGYQNIVQAICAAAEAAPMTMIGKSVQRLEDEPLMTGRGKFVANLSFPDELHMRVVRSPYAHATLSGVDVQAALALSGVAAVWTFTDVSQIPPIEFRPTKVQGLEPYRQTILARDRRTVRWRARRRRLRGEQLPGRRCGGPRCHRRNAVARRA